VTVSGRGEVAQGWINLEGPSSNLHFAYYAIVN
jgi:hypothetical protein